MGTLAIKDELPTRIAKLAEVSRLPLEAEAEKLPVDSLRRSEAAGELRRLMDTIAAMTPRDVQQTDSVQLLREDGGR